MKFANDLMQAVCDEHGVNIAMLLDSSIRTRPVSAARSAAIRRLRENHFSAKRIARLLNVTLQTVNYRLYPNYKATSDSHTARYRAQKAAA